MNTKFIATLLLITSSFAPSLVADEDSRKNWPDSIIIPLEDSPIFKNKDSSNKGAKTLTETMARANMECDFKIVNVMAPDLIKFLGAKNIDVDISAVKEILKIRVTMKAESYMGIITHIADQIDADIFFSVGKLKLVPRK